MNRSIALGLRAAPLAIALMLLMHPLSQSAYAESEGLASVTANSFNEDSAPTFLNYAEKQQAQEKKEPEVKSHNTKNTNETVVQKKKPEASHQTLLIAQKDKIIRQLQAQLAAKSVAASPSPTSDNTKELLAKINKLQEKLAIVESENQQIIKKDLADTNELNKKAVELSATKNKLMQQTTTLSSLESEKQKISSLLVAATTEKQTLGTRLSSAEAEKKELAAKLAAEQKERHILAKKLAASAPDKQDFSAKLSAAEAEKHAISAKLDAATRETQALTAKLKTAMQDQQALAERLTTYESEKQVFIQKIAMAETDRQALTAQLSAASAEKKEFAEKLATAVLETHTLTAKLDALSITQQQSATIENALKVQADKNQILLQAKTDEINQLQAKLAEAKTEPAKKTTPIDLTKEPQQQAYSIGVSMGDEALKVLSTHGAQGVKINQDVVLQGIIDSFSGELAIDPKVISKAMLDASKQLFQNLNKIEQQSIREGTQYQQKFAKQKGVVFKEGVYSRVDYGGKGKLHDSDTVTVVIKEMLIDGTVISDMEAEGKVWTQTLKKYPPLFLGPIKRLENHGSVTIVIPPNLAYGSKGRPPKIPPGATMVYTVRIVDATTAEP
ncbi:TPA: peptidylprolyl isomerase [Raoultella planticola]|nr:peptidylprolyl isomerase [Raoultella planticola]